MQRLKHAVSSLAIATTLVLTVSLFVAPATASKRQQVINGLVHPRENDFFSQGRKQTQREIQILLQERRSPDTLLKISPELLRIQRQLSPLEKLPVLPTGKRIKN